MFTVQRQCYTPAGWFSDNVEECIVPDFPCHVLSLVHVLLKNRVLLCCQTCGGAHNYHTMGRSGGRTAPDTTTRDCTSRCIRWGRVTFYIIFAANFTDDYGFLSSVMTSRFLLE